MKKGGLVLQRIPANTNISDPVLREIAVYVSALEKVSPAMLQRKYRLPYVKAAHYIDQLIKFHYIESVKDNKAFYKVIDQDVRLKDFQTEIDGEEDNGE